MWRAVGWRAKVAVEWTRATHWQGVTASPTCSARRVAAASGQNLLMQPGKDLSIFRDVDVMAMIYQQHSSAASRKNREICSFFAHSRSELHQPKFGRRSYFISFSHTPNSDLLISRLSLLWRLNTTSALAHRFQYGQSLCVPVDRTTANLQLQLWLLSFFPSVAIRVFACQPRYALCWAEQPMAIPRTGQLCPKRFIESNILSNYLLMPDP